MGKKDDGPDMPTAPFWMTTFSDMMMLLLVLFVMIVSMSKVEVKKFKEALSYFQGSTSLLEEPSMQTMQPVQFRSRQQEQSVQKLIEHLKENGLEDNVRVNVTEEGIRTVITDSVMFESGRAELIEPARAILRLLAGVIDEEVQSVAVEGHTDSRPIRTSRYPSNWELSAARASSVVRFLQRHDKVLDPRRYAAIGYGEHRPVTSNDTAEGRAQNRRVEILFSWESWPETNQTLLNNQTRTNQNPPNLAADADSL